ncbi:MAG: hypothetical protein IH840_06090 [Candidatus Heimdallarchaeota archaeon]|nr:hypothetical protein [Candidatus Heimdallarchaeota archaeon]
MESIRTHKKSIELGKQIPAPNEYSFPWYWDYSNLAEVYPELGEVDKAHQTILKYIEARDNDPRDALYAYPIANIGRVLLEKGDTEGARRYLREALKFVLKSEEPVAIGDMYKHLFDLSLAEANLKEAKLVSEKIQQLYEKNSSQDRLRDQSDLTHAIILKKSTNVRDRIKAQDLLLELIERLDFYYANLITASNHLCETYLEEIKLYGHEEAFDKAQVLIDRINGIAKEQQSMKFLVKSYLLQARLKPITGEFEQAEAIFHQAELICEEKNLVALGVRVKSEKSGFEEDLTQMQQLLNRNASIQERLKQAIFSPISMRRSI